jgi:hypothetical protein
MQGLCSESESQEIYPDSCAYILHLQRMSAATRAGLFIVEMKEKTFSASQSGKYSVTLHFRSREVRFPVQCQKFLVECGKNLVEYGKNVRTPLIYSFHSYFKIKVSIRYFNLV